MSENHRCHSSVTSSKVRQTQRSKFSSANMTRHNIKKFHIIYAISEDLCKSQSCGTNCSHVRFTSTNLKRVFGDKDSVPRRNELLRRWCSTRARTFRIWRHGSSPVGAPGCKQVWEHATIICGTSILWLARTVAKLMKQHLLAHAFLLHPMQLLHLLL